MIIRNIAVSCCLVFICPPIYSQKIDSLKALLEVKTQPDRADVLYELSYNYIDIDNNIALKYRLEGYNIPAKFNDSLRIVRARLITASALRRLQRIDSAIVIPFVQLANSLYRFSGIRHQTLFINMEL